MTNRISAIERRALLEEPEVIEAAGSELLERMRTRLEELAGQE